MSTVKPWYLYSADNDLVDNNRVNNGLFNKELDDNSWAC